MYVKYIDWYFLLPSFQFSFLVWVFLTFGFCRGDVYLVYWLEYKKETRSPIFPDHIREHSPHDPPVPHCTILVKRLKCFSVSALQDELIFL